MFCPKALPGFKNRWGKHFQSLNSSKTCWDYCRSIQFVSMVRKGAKNWLGRTRCLSDRVGCDILLFVFYNNKIASFLNKEWKKYDKKEKKQTSHFKANQCVQKSECVQELWDRTFFLYSQINENHSCFVLLFFKWQVNNVAIRLYRRELCLKCFRYRFRIYLAPTSSTLWG